jgi:hypothetical protein
LSPRLGKAKANFINDRGKAFFGVRDGDYGEFTCTFADMAETLNGIVPND